MSVYSLGCTLRNTKLQRNRNSNENIKTTSRLEKYLQNEIFIEDYYIFSLERVYSCLFFYIAKDSGNISFCPFLRSGKIDKTRLCKATVLDFSIKRPSVLTRTDTRRRRCCSSRYSCVYKLYTGENNLPIMLMYSNEIQIPFNIQRALFYFQNDKLLSLLAAVIARYASYMLCSTFYYSFSFVPRLSCAFQRVLQTSFFSRRLYRAIYGKFLRLKTRYI